MKKGNLHTHTTFCDGRDTPESMIFKALELGFDTIGFSGHSELEGCDSWCMTKERARLYRKEIFRLKEKYQGQIEVLCGVEQDFFSPAPEEPYEYRIGAVHCIKIGNSLLPVDADRETLKMIVDKYFNGSFLNMAEAYYDLVSNVVERTEADVIAHFDLITKFNRLGAFFDEQNTDYLELGYNAIDKLLKTGKPFEVNTGGISRGYLTRAYPSAPFIHYIKLNGGKLILTSDCHNLNFLDCSFADYLPIVDGMTFDDLK